MKIMKHLPIANNNVKQTVQVILTLLLSLSSAYARKPNVIIILSDDQGYADLGAYGVSKDIRTPNLDRLANGGALMTDGYVTAPQCVPSRAAIVTGRYNTSFGVDANEYVPIPKDEPTIAERMKKSGYATGFVGKWHLEPTHEGKEWMAKYWPEGLERLLTTNKGFAIPLHLRLPHSPGKKGFTDFYDGVWKSYYRNYDLAGRDVTPPKNYILKNEFRIDHQTDAALAFINRHLDEPFFLYLAYFAPHEPAELVKKYFDRFPGKMPERRRWALASASAMDDGVGKIMETLRRNGLEEDTLIFYFADNGAPYAVDRIDEPFDKWGKWDGSDNGPMVGEKGMVSEGGVRVPFLVYWKNHIKPQIYKQPVISLDVGATALAVAGIKTTAGEIDGVNLMPYLTNKKESSPHKALYWRFWGQSAVREGKWKFFYLENGTKMLFDMEENQPEKRNVIDAHPELADRLDQMLSTWRMEQKRPDFTRPWNGCEKWWYDNHFGENGRAFELKSAADNTDPGVINTTSAKVGLRAYHVHEVNKFTTADPKTYPYTYEYADMMQLNIHPNFTFVTNSVQKVREKLKTNVITEEFIFRGALDTIKDEPFEYVIERLAKAEKAGWVWGDLILYREPLFDFQCKDQELLPGPWADMRMLSVEGVSTLRKRLKEAHEKGRLRQPYYKLNQLIYCWANLGEAEKKFLLTYMDGLYIEVNSKGGNWKSEGVKAEITNKNFKRGVLYDPYKIGNLGTQDSADAVAWCVKHDFHVGFSSGSNVKDVWFKDMFEDLIGRIDAHGVSPTHPLISYLLHHNRSVDDSVMPYFPENEEASISNLIRYMIKRVGVLSGGTFKKRAAQTKPSSKELKAVSLPAYYRVNHAEGKNNLSDVYWILRRSENSFSAVRTKGEEKEYSLRFSDINSIAPANLYNNNRHY